MVCGGSYKGLWWGLWWFVVVVIKVRGGGCGSLWW